MKKISILFSALMCLMFTVNSTPALTEPASSEAKNEDETVYHITSMKNFAKTYWRFSKFDINDDEAINNFMKISECDLYNEYLHNEFEWDGIREATRKFLEENKKKFPDHYEFMQPIALGEYDFEKEGFSIAAEHKFKGVKRFEVRSDEIHEKICGDKHHIPGYPKAIALELTRPFIFDFLPIEKNLGREIISKKMSDYDKLRDIHKTRESYLKAREVFLVAKVKLFAYKEGDFQIQSRYKIANMLGILERIEVYEDPQLTNLLYSRDFRRKKRTVKKDF